MGGTPLISAASHGYVEIVDKLLSNGANVDAVDLGYSLLVDKPPGRCRFEYANNAICFTGKIILLHDRLWIDCTHECF